MLVLNYQDLGLGNYLYGDRLSHKVSQNKKPLVQLSARATLKTHYMGNSLHKINPFSLGFPSREKLTDVHIICSPVGVSMPKYLLRNTNNATVNFTRG